MAKKNKKTKVVGSSAFTGGLGSFIGCGIVMLLCIAIMGGIGAGIVYALNGFNFTELGTTDYVAFGLAGVFVLIGLAWAAIKLIKWFVKHIVISEKKFVFKATALQLLGTCIKWLFLTVITAGLFIFWLPFKAYNWVAKHTTIDGEATTAANDNNNGYPQPQISFYTYPQN